MQAYPGPSTGLPPVFMGVSMNAVQRFAVCPFPNMFLVQMHTRMRWSQLGSTSFLGSDLGIIICFASRRKAPMQHLDLNSHN